VFETQRAVEDAVVLVDGVFLYRPELDDCWDYRIFLEVDPIVALECGLQRDAGWMGSREEARRRYETRYMPGERMYLDAVRPWAVADTIVVNDTPASPGLRFVRSSSVLIRRFATRRVDAQEKFGFAACSCKKS
jgi:uridine kinase